VTQHKPGKRATISLVLPFKQVFLDSNAFLAAGWPSISAALANNLVLADEVGVDVILLAEVEMELKARWLRDYAKTQREAQHKVDNLNRVIRAISKTKNHTLAAPDPDHIEKSYKRTVDELVKRAGVKRVGFSKTALKQVFGMAIAQQLPFREKGSGFQDAVILLAIIRHAAKSKEKTAAFVSRDGVFSQEAIDSLATPFKVRITVFKGLDQLNGALMQEFTGRRRDQWSADFGHALEAIEENRDQLREFIASNFEVPERIGFFRAGRILRLTGLDIVSIEAVHTPAPWTRPKNAQVTISADILIKVHMIVERRTMTSTERLLKVGVEAPPSPRTTWAVEPKEESQNYTVELEINAQNVDGKYENLVPISVKRKAPEPPTFPGLDLPPLGSSDTLG
jgi:hypothetical protein